MARTKFEAIKKGNEERREKKEKEKEKRTGVKPKASKAAPKGASFVVSTLQEWRSDGWHSYQGPGETKTDSVHKTLNAANKRAHKLFYKKNPWGLGVDEIEDMDVDEAVDQAGCVTLRVFPPDSESWIVKVEMVAGKK